MGSKGSNTTTTNSAPPQYITDAYQNVIGRAQTAANAPFQTYQGQRVADFSQPQQTAFGTVDNAQGIAQPYINTATGYAAAGAAPVADLSAADINKYYNPWQQSVIDATKANMFETNSRQQQQVVGNAALQGALGGDRVKVAQAELARQQDLANNKTLADLSAQGFHEAAQLAGNQQLIQQQNAARAGQAAYTYGNLGTEALNTTLTGANAQLQTGAQQQAREQQLLNEPRQDFVQGQAYPFQTANFLAGIDTAVGSNAGGTSSTTTPPPDRTGQIIGAAGTAAGLALSDERAKEDIQQVGQLFDGQPVYRFRYRGDPQMQIGLIAQEVEHDHPDAVGEEGGGLLGVDYDAATDQAAERGHFALGGDTGGIGGMPYAGVQGYVPTSQMTMGRGPPAPPKPPKQEDPMGKGIAGLGKGFGNYLGKQADEEDGDYYGGSPETNDLLAPSSHMEFDGGYAEGGEVHPHEEGSRLAGLVGSIATGLKDHFPGLGTADMAPRPEMAPRQGFDDGGGVLSPKEYIDQQWGDVYGSPDMDQSGDNNHPLLQRIDEPIVPKSVHTMAFSGAGEPNIGAPDDAIPMPRPRPDEPDLGGVGAPREGSLDARIADTIPLRSPARPAPAPEERRGFFDRPLEKGGTFENSIFGEGKWKPNMPLLAAGLGMMASRSPNLGNMIGEGGQAGLAQYTQQKQQDEATAHRAGLLDIQKQRVGFEGQRLAETAKHNAALAKHQADTLAATIAQRSDEQKRHADELRLRQLQPVDMGVDPTTGAKVMGVRDPKDGLLRRIDPRTGALSEPLPPGAEPPVDTSSLTGDDYLATIPTDRANLIKKLANYEMDPRLLPNRGESRERLMKQVVQYDPTYDQVNYAPRAAAIKEFNTGGKNSPAGQITAGNTAIQHLAQLSEISQRLGGTGEWGFANMPLNKLNIMSQHMRNNPDLVRYDGMLERYVEEATTFYRGIGGAEADIKRGIERITAAQSPEARNAAFHQEAEAMYSKVNAMQDRYRTAMGDGGFRKAASLGPLKDFPIIQQKSEAAMKVLQERAQSKAQAPAATTEKFVPPEGSQINKAGTKLRLPGGEIVDPKTGKPIGP